MAFIRENLAEFRIKKCEQKIAYYNFVDPILKLEAMFHACKHIYKKLSFIDVWDHPQKELLTSMD